MSENSKPYSKHLYDKKRIALAQTILQKESRKLFLGLNDQAWQDIDRSIQGWAKNPKDYHLESDGPRDFWDIFASFMEGIKLKPNFTAWITAENIQWHKVTLPVCSIQMTSPLEQLKNIPGLILRNDIPLVELKDLLDKNPDAREEQKRLIDRHSTDPAQDAYPVIVRQADGGLFKVMDGNRRTLKAVIYGQQDIEAWVGKMEGSEPVNFWVPINDMLQLVRVFKEATNADNEPLQRAVAQVLKARFKVSAVAEQAYQNRIYNQSEIAKRVFKLAQHY